MRVTNEKLQNDLMLYGEDTDTAIYAADLLDARATIEKQSALIKEMREYIDESIIFGDVGRINLRFNKDKQEALLERTKEYK